MVPVTKITIQDMTCHKSELPIILKPQLVLQNADQVIGFPFIIKQNYPEILEKSVTPDLTQEPINNQLTSFWELLIPSNVLILPSKNCIRVIMPLLPAHPSKLGVEPELKPHSAEV